MLSLVVGLAASTEPLILFRDPDRVVVKHAEAVDMFSGGHEVPSIRGTFAQAAGVIGGGHQGRFELRARALVTNVASTSKDADLWILQFFSRNVTAKHIGGSAQERLPKTDRLAPIWLGAASVGLAAALGRYVLNAAEK